VPAPRASVPRTTRREAAPRSASAPQDDVASNQLDEELKLLSGARAALKRGEATGTIERLEEHERRFPAGALGMEARALWVDALCEAGRREAAQEAADAFLKRWPDSPLAVRVRGACR
jgi:outer membrane protein assembly factor BamD (BamD/ComL family)